MRLPSLLNWIFPCRCIKCKSALKNDQVICDTCLHTIRVCDFFVCARCGARLPEDKKVCHQSTPYMLAAATSYHNETVTALVHALKFRNRRAAAIPLASLVIDCLKSHHDFLKKRNFIVVPIPLGKNRLRQRGFNQSQVLAQYIASHFDLPLYTDMLIRTRDTKPQSKLGAKERRQNVTDCFTVSAQYSIAKKSIVLIDDVVTSGATLGEAAHVLKDAGANTILGVVIAKA